MVLVAVATERERPFQDEVVRTARALGWRAVHFADARLRSGQRAVAVEYDARGWPDLVLVRERVVFAELKVENGIVSAAQGEWLERLRRAGAETYVWRPAGMPEIERVLARQGRM